MTTIKTLQPSYPPSSGILSGQDTGTITNIQCLGRTTLQLFSGSSTGALLYSVQTTGPCNIPVSIAFTNGLYQVHKTHSAVILTMS